MYITQGGDRANWCKIGEECNMRFGQKHSEKIGTKLKKNNHHCNIHDKGPKINKGRERIIIL